MVSLLSTTSLCSTSNSLHTHTHMVLRKVHVHSNTLKPCMYSGPKHIYTCNPVCRELGLTRWGVRLWLHGIYSYGVNHFPISRSSHFKREGNGLTYCIVLKFCGSLISWIFNRLWKYFNENFWHAACSVYAQRIHEIFSTKSSKITIRKNLDPRKFSTIQ